MENTVDKRKAKSIVIGKCFIDKFPTYEMRILMIFCVVTSFLYKAFGDHDEI